MMPNKLDAIIKQKQQEVASLKANISFAHHTHLQQILAGTMKAKVKGKFKSSLRGKQLAIIAEIKRRSPSKGDLAQIPDPIQLAKEYIAGGANALSILTDEKFFAGSLKDLNDVATITPGVPILRKDFIIDPIQIAESVAANADAILAIVAVLGQNTKEIIDQANAFGLDVLVEVHDAFELDIALAAGAEIIGINNRNLSTFTVDTTHALQLIDQIPKHIIRVAESGITDPLLAQHYFQAGFDAVLIGEALVQSTQKAEFIEACRYE